MQNRHKVTLPDPLEHFSALMHEKSPHASIEIDRPADPLGEWWIAIRCKKFRCDLVWQSKHGFGIFTSKPGYADHPDEVYRSADVVMIRLSQLIDQWQRSGRFRPLTLTEIRQLRETRQTTLAAALDINQAAVSRLEHRNDMKLSSLQSYVQAMDGRIEIRVHFDAFDAVISVSPDDDSPSNAARSRT